MIVTLTGPSGVGKGHLTFSIQSVFNAKIVPWTTTRRPRGNDLSIGNRRFVSREDFVHMNSQGLLTGVQVLHGEHYGLEKSILDHVRENELYVCEINSANVLEMFPFIRCRFSIALISENSGLLRNRIVSREPTISDSQLSSRLEIAIREVELIKAHSAQFHLLVNIDLYPETAVVPLAIEALKKGV